MTHNHTDTLDGERLHFDDDPQICRLCHLVNTDATWYRLIGVKNIHRTCIHLGEATGKTAKCIDGCRGVSLKTFGCKIHGECTPKKRGEGVKGCCEDAAGNLCPDRAYGKMHQIVVSTGGIGDHLMGLSLAARWREDFRSPICLVVNNHARWVEMFEGYDELTTDQQPDLPHAYDMRNTGPHYVQSAMTKPLKKPVLRPLPISMIAWASQYQGTVLLSPLTTGKPRDWIPSHWVALEQQIISQGLSCAAICGSHELERMPKLKSPIITGRSPQEIAALMRSAGAVVANESGMAHLAGILDTPAVVLSGQPPGEKIHAFWKTTRVIRGPLGCSGCNWQGPYFRPQCNDFCASLQAITPDRVMEELLPIIRRSHSCIIPA